MRARFTDSIASRDGWAYGAGTEVSVAGDQFAETAVPELAGLAWLESGLLEPVPAAPETASSPRPRAASRR